MPALPLSLTIATRVRARPGVVWRVMRGGPMVLNVETGRYFHLLGASAAIWRLIENHHALAAVIDAAAAEHGERIDVVQPDVVDFIASALSQGLLEIEPESEPAVSTDSDAVGAATLTLGRAGLTIGCDLDALRAAFDRQHYVRLPQLIEPRVLDSIRQSIDAAQFVDRTHPGIGTEQCLAVGPAIGALQLLFNDPALFAAIGRISGCEGIRCFDGRVYRMRADEGHYDSWHSDAGRNRCIAVSVNLSPRRYDGGLLEIRQASSAEAEHVVAPVPYGSAVMFRISAALRHRVTPVRGTAPRTAYAGWFCTAPDFQDTFFAALSQ